MAAESPGHPAMAVIKTAGQPLAVVVGAGGPTALFMIQSRSQSQATQIENEHVQSRPVARTYSTAESEFKSGGMPCTQLVWPKSPLS
jgi:hypothetical protein